jgi:amino acid transporter
MNETRDVSRSDVEINIPIAILLSIITCGIYGFFWNYYQMSSLNQMLGEKRFSFLVWFCLVFLTCGLYHIYHEYKMAEAITTVQSSHEKPVNDTLSVISLVLSILGMVIITDAIQQHEINKLVQ